MKKALLSIVCLVILSTSALAVTGYPTKARIKNVTLTSANTKYEAVIPPGTGAIQIQSRTAADCAIYLSTDASVYFTVKSGAALNIAPLAVDQSLYFQSGTAGQIIEIMYWQ